MKTVVFKKKQVIALAASYVCVRLEGKRGKSLLEKLGLRGVPSYAVLEADGTEIESFTGTTDEQKIRSMLQGPLESLVEIAQTALLAAHALSAGGKHLPAYKAYALLATRLTWSEPSQEARKAIAAMKQDKKVWPGIELALAEEKARVLLSRAEGLLAKSSHGEALRWLDDAAKKYPRTTSGKRAKKLADGMRSDPAVMQAIKAAAQEKRARSWWNLAASYLRNKLDDKAKGYLQKIVKQCPDSSYAERAKAKL
ncbi:hypothetical protein JYT15_01160, partial [Acidimicrobium ferrooxidans]|nr:hypothetical protein [Acidimicrobium ferrooxidans]